MGFPSPATDYVEHRISLDGLCNTGAPSVYLFKAGETVMRAGISKGSLLVVDSAITPSDGNVVVAMIDGTFRVARYCTHPAPYLEDMNVPGRRLATAGEDVMQGEETICFGVVTHALGVLRSAYQ